MEDSLSDPSHILDLDKDKIALNYAHTLGQIIGMRKALEEIEGDRS